MDGPYTVYERHFKTAGERWLSVGECRSSTRNVNATVSKAKKLSEPVISEDWLYYSYLDVPVVYMYTFRWRLIT